MEALKIRTEQKNVESALASLAAKYHVGSVIAEDSHAVVLLSIDKRTGETVIVKVPKAGSLDSLAAEQEFYATIPPCDSIAQCIESSLQGCYPYIVLEWMPTDTFTLMSVNNRHLETAEIRTLLRQTLLALQAVHSHGFAHRDIKPENILINTNNSDCAENWDVKLAGFGSVYNCHGQPTCPSWPTLGVAGHYAAPEVLMSDDQVEPKATDIWSLGVVMFNLFTTFNPWDKALLSDPLFSCYTLQPGDYSLWVRAYHRECPDPDFEDLFFQMCRPIPTERLTAEQCLAHPFLRE